MLVFFVGPEIFMKIVNMILSGISIDLCAIIIPVVVEPMIWPINLMQAMDSLATFFHLLAVSQLKVS